MWEDIARLHEFHREVPTEMGILKLTEEIGEAAEALIGMRGMNSRKGVCRTREDLLDELADVIITAAVVMAGVSGSAEQAGEHFGRRLSVVTGRAGLR
jgi:NTP pyrophosphatase (non-canonical NTP hydrolase)